MSPASGRTAAAQPRVAPGGLDQHGEIFVALRDRIAMEVRGLAVGERQTRKIGKPCRVRKQRAAACRVGLLLHCRQIAERFRRE